MKLIMKAPYYYLEEYPCSRRQNELDKLRAIIQSFVENDEMILFGEIEDMMNSNYFTESTKAFIKERTQIISDYWVYSHKPFAPIKKMRWFESKADEILNCIEICGLAFTIVVLEPNKNLDQAKYVLSVFENIDGPVLEIWDKHGAFEEKALLRLKIVLEDSLEVIEKS